MSSKNSAAPTLRSFYIRLTLFSVFAFAVLQAWKQFTSLRFQTDLGWAIVLFFIVATASIHILLVRSAEKSPQKFVMNYMAISGLRLFGYLIIILIYAVLKRDAALGFTLLFLLMYFLFSAFEVATFLRHFKR